MDARIVITLERDPITGQPSYTCQLMAFSPADGQFYLNPQKLGGDFHFWGLDSVWIWRYTDSIDRK